MRLRFALTPLLVLFVFLQISNFADAKEVYGTGIDRDLISLFQKKAVDLYEQGNHEQAVKLAGETVKLGVDALSNRDPELAVIYKTAGLLHQGVADYSAALWFHKKALRIWSSSGSLAEVARDLNNQGLCLQALGAYDRARVRYERALAIEESISPAGVQSAPVLNNLAGLYRMQKNFAGAEEMHKRALDIWRRNFGDEDLRTAKSLNNLALLYQDEGRFSEALRLQEQALSIREKKLHRSDPSLAVSLNNLAGLYRREHQFEKAEGYYQRALVIFEASGPGDRIQSAKTLNNLALLYQDMGRTQDAEKLCVRAHALSRQILGPKHPMTVQIASNLAELQHSHARPAVPDVPAAA